jgi:hypothetical protein
LEVPALSAPVRLHQTVHHEAADESLAQAADRDNEVHEWVVGGRPAYAVDLGEGEGMLRREPSS